MRLKLVWHAAVISTELEGERHRVPDRGSRGTNVI